MKPKKISKKLNLNKTLVADLQHIKAGGTIPYTEYVDSQCSENTTCYTQEGYPYKCGDLETAE